MASQIPYAVFVVSLFLAYGALVRRGVVTGRAIIGVGILVGVAAAAASYVNIPPLVRQQMPLPLLLIAPGSMALCAAVCIAFAYRSQKIEDLAVHTLGDTRIVVRYTPANRIEADALLLPTVTTFRPLGGLSGAVGVAAGSAPEKEAQAVAPAKVGKVVATTGGKLRVTRIFHVAVHEPLRPVEAAPLRRGLENAAQQARKAGAETIAVPVGALRGLPVAQGATITAEAVLKQRRAFSEIVFVVLELRHAPIVRDAVAKAVQGLTRK